MQDSKIVWLKVLLQLCSSASMANTNCSNRHAQTERPAVYCMSTYPRTVWAASLRALRITDLLQCSLKDIPENGHQAQLVSKCWTTILNDANQ